MKYLIILFCILLFSCSTPDKRFEEVLSNKSDSEVILQRTQKFSEDHCETFVTQDTLLGRMFLYYVDKSGDIQKRVEFNYYKNK